MVMFLRPTAELLAGGRLPLQEEREITAIY